MLEGRLGNTSGAPYIEARLSFPRLKLIGLVSFPVDTGADGTVLMPADSKKLGIDFKSLKNPTTSQGIDFGPIRAAWADLPDARVAEYETVLPGEWAGAAVAIKAAFALIRGNAYDSAIAILRRAPNSPEIFDEDQVDDLVARIEGEVRPHDLVW
jgi:hypothetical protein